MFRYIRLFGYFVRFSFSQAMEFRVDFFFRIIMDCVYYLFNFVMFEIIYDYTNLLGGWSLPQVRVFIGAFIVIDAIQMTFVANNVWGLAKFINHGDLDYYLVRPVSSLFFLSLRSFAANSFLNLLIAIGLFLWTLSGLPSELSKGSLILFCTLIINGTFLHYILHFLSMIPTFWTHSWSGFQDLFWHVEKTMESPDGIFRGWIRTVFTTALPFSLMASFPSRLFFDGLDLGILLHILGVTSGFFGLLLFLWRLGLKNYSSASS